MKPFHNDISTFSNDMYHASMVHYHYGMTLTIMECFIMARPNQPFCRVASGVTWNVGSCTHTPRLRPAASFLRDDPRRASHTLAERQSLTTETAVAAGCRATQLHGDTNQPNGGFFLTILSWQARFSDKWKDSPKDHA